MNTEKSNSDFLKIEELTPTAETLIFKCLLTGRTSEKLYFISGAIGPFLDPCICITFLKNAFESGILDESTRIQLEKKLYEDCNNIKVDYLENLRSFLIQKGQYIGLFMCEELILDKHVKCYTKFDHLKITESEFRERLKTAKALEELSKPAPKKRKRRTTKNETDDNNSPKKKRISKKKIEKTLFVYLLPANEDINSQIFKLNSTDENQIVKLEKDPIEFNQITNVFDKQGNFKIFLTNSNSPKVNSRMNSIAFGETTECAGDCVVLTNKEIYPDGQ